MENEETATRIAHNNGKRCQEKRVEYTHSSVVQMLTLRTS